MVIQYSTASSSFYASKKYRAYVCGKMSFFVQSDSIEADKRYEMEEKDEERWNPRLLKRRIEEMRKDSATWW